MAKKIKKDAFDDVMNSAFPNDKTISWNGVSFVVKRTIDLTEMLGLVKNVAESCFDDNGVYMPELRDFAFRVNVVGKYTDIAMPVGSDKQYALLYRTNLYSSIVSEIDEAQMAAVCEAIEEKIQYECDIQMRDIRVRLEKAIESLGAVADSSMTLFGNIGQDDMAKLVKVVSNSKLDEAAVVEAFLSQSKK